MVSKKSNELAEDQIKAVSGGSKEALKECKDILKRLCTSDQFKVASNDDFQSGFQDVNIENGDEGEEYDEEED